MNTDKVLLVFVAIGAILIVLSSFSGANRFLTVLSGSMAPTLNQGDLVVTSTVPPSAIQPGDIISFVSGEDRTIVTHRVVNVTDQGFIVKGDANNAPDASTVNTKNVVGKMAFSLPLAGYIFYFSKSVYGFLAFIVVPGVLIIVNEAKKIKRSMKSAGKFGFSGPLLLIMILATLLMMSFGPTSAFFNDFEASTGNFIALGPSACTFVNVSKWWTDSNFLPFWDMNYNGSFDVVTHFNDKKGGSYKISGTNPGSFFVHINITGLPEIKAGDSFYIEDELLTSLDGFDDFGYQSKNPVRIFTMEEDCGWGGCEWQEITNKFEYSLVERDPWVFRLKSGESIPKVHALYVTIHLQYILQELTEDQLDLFPFNYTNIARVYVKNKWFESYYATITGNIKEVSGWVAGASAGTAPYFPVPEDIIVEEPGQGNEEGAEELDESVEAPEEETQEEPTETEEETVPEETTGEETEETPTEETEQPEETSEEVPEETETILNETTAIFSVAAGANVFLVPEGYATTAYQLILDYPLILDVSYADAEGNIVAYAAGDLIESSFDIVAGMTITINASEPFDIV